MAGVAGFEPTNDGVRGGTNVYKLLKNSLFLSKNARFFGIHDKSSPNFPQFTTQPFMQNMGWKSSTKINI
jgi:hypothetical protein